MVCAQYFVSAEKYLAFQLFGSFLSKHRLKLAGVESKKLLKTPTEDFRLNRGSNGN